MPNTATWIFDVAGISRDDLNVGVIDSLPRDLAAIHTDVERTGAELAFKLLADQSNEVKAPCILGGIQLEDPERLATASLEDCLKLLTVIARADRFNEGYLGSMIESGQVAAILRRIQDIRDAGGQDGA